MHGAFSNFQISQLPSKCSAAPLDFYTFSSLLSAPRPKQNGVCRPSESLAWVNKTVRAAFASTRDSSQGLETSFRKVNRKISWISRTVTRPYCINRCNLQSRICRSWIAQWCVANCLPFVYIWASELSTARSAVPSLSLSSHSGLSVQGRSDHFTWVLWLFEFMKWSSKSCESVDFRLNLHLRAPV